MSINKRFKEVRIKAGYTQTQFANLLGENQQSITDIETGKKKPSLEILEKIGIKLGISLDWMICNVGKMKKSIDIPQSDELREPSTNETSLQKENLELLKENRQLRMRIEQLEGKGGQIEKDKPKLYK